MNDTLTLMCVVNGINNIPIHNAPMFWLDESNRQMVPDFQYDGPGYYHFLIAFRDLVIKSIQILEVYPTGEYTILKDSAVDSIVGRGDVVKVTYLSNDNGGGGGTNDDPKPPGITLDFDPDDLLKDLVMVKT